MTHLLTSEEFARIVAGVRDAVERSAASDAIPNFRISADTYRLWKAMGGNAKSRRRYRRRELVNTQRAKRIEE